eukprot:SAG11_NODE_32253_length_285_cov_0.827957_1_plen_41_part_10
MPAIAPAVFDYQTTGELSVGTFLQIFGGLFSGGVAAYVAIK